MPQREVLALPLGECRIEANCVIPIMPFIGVRIS